MNCATNRMLTHSVDRTADGTEVAKSLMSVICEWIDWFANSRDMGEV